MVTVVAMERDTAQDSPVTEAPADTAADAPAEATPVVREELLVEEISIDGMCGVY